MSLLVGLMSVKQFIMWETRSFFKPARKKIN
jgi:hypothetical protein